MIEKGGVGQRRPAFAKRGRQTCFAVTGFGAARTGLVKEPLNKSTCMQRSFTRQELYELVWNHPRTALAKQLGVSDVWIAKQCRSVCIPMPPPGYWARAQHGKSSRRPSLPTRLPGHLRAVVIGDSPSSRWGRVKDWSEQPAPPVFEEDMSDQVGAALALIGKIAAKRDLSQPHRALSRILAREEKRRATFAERGWSLDKPLFEDTAHQRQLRIFNSLSWILDCVVSGSDVLDDDQWIKGLGTTHRLRLRIDFGGTAMDVRFLEPTAAIKVIGEKPPATTTIRIEPARRDLPAEEWRDQPGDRLEQQLPEITKALLLSAERRLRFESQRQYEWRLERHQEHLKELEARRVEAEQRRLLAIEERRKKIRDGILALAQDARMARELRSLITSLEQHPDLQGELPATFKAWRNEALELAASLDPMKRPILDLLGDFGAPEA